MSFDLRSLLKPSANWLFAFPPMTPWLEHAPAWSMTPSRN